MSMVRRIIVTILIVWRLGSGELYGQCEGTNTNGAFWWDFQEEEDSGISIGSLLGNLFTPQILRDTKEIRAYIRDPRFAELARRCGDLRAVDAIYLKALKIAEFNIARALVVSMMATLEHQKVEVKAPFLGAIPLPLSFEEDTLFRMRVRNLPTKLYPDTPPIPAGDRDKLQHFFASAYIAFVTESPELARSAGNFVEWGEAQFIVGGADDPRDRRANKLGELFGHDLVYVRTILPSDYFSLPVDDEP
ncbi:MAG TPA: hypothetical protein VNN76_06515 [Bacteroidota bacterium]|nr:hypothetical protein [Bacteroidota bacterium]